MPSRVRRSIICLRSHEAKRPKVLCRGNRFWAMPGNKGLVQEREQGDFLGNFRVRGRLGVKIIIMVTPRANGGTARSKQISRIGAEVRLLN